MPSEEYRAIEYAIQAIKERDKLMESDAHREMELFSYKNKLEQFHECKGLMREWKDLSVELQDQVNALKKEEK